VKQDRNLFQRIFWGNYEKSRLKRGTVALIATFPSVAAFLICHEIFELDEVPCIYVAGLLFYSFLAFGWGAIEEGSVLFSREDNRSVGVLFLAHLGITALLFALVQLLLSLRPHFPARFLVQDRKGFSLFWAIVFGVVIIFLWNEATWLSGKRRARLR
jgi:hypothetical protein